MRNLEVTSVSLLSLVRRAFSVNGVKARVDGVLMLYVRNVIYGAML